jgi:hypothetical protein
MHAEAVEGPFAGYYCCDPDWQTVYVCPAASTEKWWKRLLRSEHGISMEEE